MTALRIGNPFLAAGTFAGETYVKREADSQLRLEIETNRRYPYIIAPHQSGKSSLMLHVARSLEKSDFRWAFVDLSLLTSDSYDSFMMGFAKRCVRQLTPEASISANSDLKSSLKELLKIYNQRIVIFVDEVNVLQEADFKAEFLETIRGIYNARGWEPEFAGLQFVLAGRTHLFQMASGRRRASFDVGVPIELSGLTLEQVSRITTYLGKGACQVDPELGSAVRNHTDGLVYLTQLILENLWIRHSADNLKTILPRDVRLVVDDIVNGAAEIAHFSEIYKELTRSSARREAFAQLREAMPIAPEPLAALRLVGILDEAGGYRSGIYRRVFGEGGPLEISERRVDTAAPTDAWPGAQISTEVELRQISVMRCSLVLADGGHPPEDPEILNEVRPHVEALAQQVIGEYQGMILGSFAGDGWLFSFGYPDPFEKAAHRAVQGALELMARSAESGSSLEAEGQAMALRFGIHTCPLAIPREASGRQQVPMFGAAPHLAVELQKRAEANAIVISESTCRLLENDYICEPLPSVRLPGLPRPIRVFRVVDPVQSTAAQIASISKRDAADHATSVHR